MNAITTVVNGTIASGDREACRALCEVLWMAYSRMAYTTHTGEWHEDKALLRALYYRMDAMIMAWDKEV